MQELREFVKQLKADNERLGQRGSGDASSVSGAESGSSVTERLLFVPRDRKCPMFTGKSGMKINDWIEEADSCMRARHLSARDQAFFLFDHLDGEARQEIKYCPSADRNDPEKIKSILQELYGCSQSYVALQEAFFSRKQQDGETLLEFSLALICLMDKVKKCARMAW